MRKKNPKTINDYLDDKYGKSGTKSRSEFKQKAQAYMVAELVKEARKKAKLTQEELAQKIDLKRPHISRIERAETDVRISTLQKIAQGLGGNLSISFDV
jgi:ribosome-binding protein aMBF1 (putative translation factor)